MVCLSRIRLCEMTEGRQLILIGAEGECRDVCAAPRVFPKRTEVDLLASIGIRVCVLDPILFLLVDPIKKTSHSLPFENMLNFVGQGTGIGRFSSVCKTKDVALFVRSLEAVVLCLCWLSCAKYSQ
jgi:hypothetical protein